MYPNRRVHEDNQQVRNQPETAEDAESTGEHHGIQQQAIFRFFPHFVVFDGFI